jgi:hypothetical protein
MSALGAMPVLFVLGTTLMTLVGFGVARLVRRSAPVPVVLVACADGKIREIPLDDERLSHLRR